jgi:hypothetical protein
MDTSLAMRATAETELVLQLYSLSAGFQRGCSRGRSKEVMGKMQGRSARRALLGLLLGLIAHAPLARSSDEPQIPDASASYKSDAELKELYESAMKIRFVTTLLLRAAALTTLWNACQLQCKWYSAGTRQTRPGRSNRKLWMTSSKQQGLEHDCQGS